MPNRFTAHCISDMRGVKAWYRNIFILSENLFISFEFFICGSFCARCFLIWLTLYSSRSRRYVLQRSVIDASLLSFCHWCITPLYILSLMDHSSRSVIDASLLFIFCHWWITPLVLSLMHHSSLYSVIDGSLLSFCHWCITPLYILIHVRYLMWSYNL